MLKAQLIYRSSEEILHRTGTVNALKSLLNNLIFFASVV